MLKRGSPSSAPLPTSLKAPLSNASTHTANPTNTTDAKGAPNAPKPPIVPIAASPSAPEHLSNEALLTRVQSADAPGSLLSDYIPSLLSSLTSGDAASLTILTYILRRPSHPCNSQTINAVSAAIRDQLSTHAKPLKRPSPSIAPLLEVLLVFLTSSCETAPAPTLEQSTLRALLSPAESSLSPTPLHAAMLASAAAAALSNMAPADAADAATVGAEAAMDPANSGSQVHVLIALACAPFLPRETGQMLVVHALDADALAIIDAVNTQQPTTSSGPYADGRFDRRTVDLETAPTDLFPPFLDLVLRFLAAFPPRPMHTTHIERLSHLVATMLESCPLVYRTRLATAVCDRLVRTGDDAPESSDRAPEGAFVQLLSLAAAVFPLVLRPLVALLSALAIDKRTSAHALNFLERRLFTLVEVAEGYSDALVALDENHEDVWTRIRDHYGDLAYRAARFIANDVCPFDVDPDSSASVASPPTLVFVQAMHEIPAALYRPDIPAGAVGLADPLLSTVAWIQPWNALGALVYVLHTLLSLLSNTDDQASPRCSSSSPMSSVRGSAPAPDVVAMLPDLVISACAAMDLISKLGVHGSPTLRGHIASTFGIASTVADIAAILLSPRARRSALAASFGSPDALRALLLSSVTCIASLVGDPRPDDPTAHIVARALSPTVQHPHFGGFIASFDEFGLVLAALACVRAGLSVESSATRVEEYRQQTSRKRPADDNDSFASVMMTGVSAKSMQERRHVPVIDAQVVLYAETIDHLLCESNLVQTVLTASRDDQISSAQRSILLVPAWTMRMLQTRPHEFLNSASSASLVASMLSSASGEGTDSEAEIFLYPAICEGLVACVSALRCRIKQLGFGPEERNGVSESRGEESLTPLEQVLLRPDVAKAMAVICAGSAKALRRQTFYSAWLNSTDRHLLPVRERNLGELPYSSFLPHMGSALSYGTSAQAWCRGMMARCLSLQMDCLSHYEHSRDVHQIPWPSLFSTADAQDCVGKSIREGIAKQICDDDCPDILGLLLAVLTCHQRAASRSLYGPRRKPVMGIAKEMRTSFKGNGQDGRTEEGSRQESDERSPLTAGSGTSEDADPLPAVLRCMRRTFDSCVRLMREAGQHRDGKDKLSFLIRLGRLSAATGRCVRLFRVGLSSQNSRWFRQHITSDIWEVMASMLRCASASDEAQSFDLSQVMTDWYSGATVERLRENMGLAGTEELCSKVELIVDVAAIWTGIVADLFQLLSKEILDESTDALRLLRNEESYDFRLPESLFRKPLFRAFAGVFSESWIFTLLEDGGRSQNEIHERDGLGSGQFSSKGPVSLRVLKDRMFKGIENHAPELAARQNTLRDFDRSGDLAEPYGASYAFDVARLRKLLDGKCEESSRNSLLTAAIDLNLAIGRQDVYLQVVSAFSEMTAAVLFLDSLSPSRSLDLSYSSPQFGGKLCRYLPRVLINLYSRENTSVHFQAIAFELSRLMSTISVGLTKEEMEQSALTSMRHGENLGPLSESSQSTPLGQICTLVDAMHSPKTSARLQVWEYAPLQKPHILRCLLLTASRYAHGPSFRSADDLRRLSESCVMTLDKEAESPEVCVMACTALTETLSNLNDEFIQRRFATKTVDTLLYALDANASRSHLGDGRKEGEAAVGLMAVLGRIVTKSDAADRSSPVLSLRRLNASGVQSMLPSGNEHQECYDYEGDARSVSHLVWCSFLQLVSAVIPDEAAKGNYEGMGSDKDRYVVEFCSMHLETIVSSSMDIHSHDGSVSLTSQQVDQGGHGVVTLAKVEEAELGATVLSRLAPFALVLQITMPHSMRDAARALCRYISQAIRILRCDPIERSVRPTTWRERQRSGVGADQLASWTGSSANGQSASRLSPSPGGTRGMTSETPKRSPSQALKAAISGKVYQGLVSPSPSSSFTPLISPMPHAHDVRGSPPYFSPNSPWGQFGSGLLTRTGHCFAEETSMSLLRGLCAALDGIRQLSDHLGVFPFGPTMETVGDSPGMGTLLAVLKFACWGLNREGDDDLRRCLLDIADITMHLTVSHAMAHAERGSLAQSVRDEVRKRVTTILYRANSLVPPIASSLLRDEGLMALWKRF